MIIFTLPDDLIMIDPDVEGGLTCTAQDVYSKSAVMCEHDLSTVADGGSPESVAEIKVYPDRL